MRRLLTIRAALTLVAAGALALPALAHAEAEAQVDVTSARTALQGEHVPFTIRLQNVGDLVGLTLFVDVITPAGGADADSATDDGLTLDQVSFPDTLTRGGDYPADLRTRETADMFMARGFGGQFIAIVPSRDAVIVMLNAAYGGDVEPITDVVANILAALPR